MKITDTEMLDFIEKNRAWISYASDEIKRRQFRCKVQECRPPTPTIYERSGRVGFASTVRKAISRAMSDKGLSDYYKNP